MANLDAKRTNVARNQVASKLNAGFRKGVSMATLRDNPTKKNPNQQQHTSTGVNP